MFGFYSSEKTKSEIKQCKQSLFLFPHLSGLNDVSPWWDLWQKCLSACELHICPNHHIILEKPTTQWCHSICWPSFKYRSFYNMPLKSFFLNNSSLTFRICSCVFSSSIFPSAGSGYPFPSWTKKRNWELYMLQKTLPFNDMNRFNIPVTGKKYNNANKTVIRIIKQTELLFNTTLYNILLPQKGKTTTHHWLQVSLPISGLVGERYWGIGPVGRKFELVSLEFGCCGSCSWKCSSHLKLSHITCLQGQVHSVQVNQNQFVAFIFMQTFSHIFFLWWEQNKELTCLMTATLPPSFHWGTLGRWHLCPVQMKEETGV